MNVFNTVKHSIFGNNSPIHVRETSGAVANYPVDQKCRMLLIKVFISALKQNSLRALSRAN